MYIRSVLLMFVPQTVFEIIWTREKGEGVGVLGCFGLILTSSVNCL